MSLAQMIDIDLTPEIDRIPRKPGHLSLPLRGPEDAITFHFSDVVYADRSEAAELRAIIEEARYHINKNWGEAGKPPVYADGYMYDVVVLTSGKIVRTRRDRRQLYHAGNRDANRASWSVHVPLGQGQDLSEPQRAALFRLFDALRAETNIPRARVVGHNEWPRTSGAPQPASTYRLLSGQSACPGPILHRHLVSYRAMSDEVSAGRYITTRDVPVREAPRVDAPVAWDGRCTLPRGFEFDLVPAAPGWLHWAPAGFVPTDAVRSVDGALLDEDYTADSPILGAPRGTAARWVAVLSERSAVAGYTLDDVSLIVSAYQELGEALGVDWFLALAQVAHETGRLTSWWCRRPRRNPAGLGVTGHTVTLQAGQRPPPPRSWARDGGIYREGLSFQAWRDEDASDGEGSISHHLGRLLAYALPAGKGTSIQQRYINRALALRPLPAEYRGIAPTLVGLNGRWAYPGTTYGKTLARYANVVRKATA